MSAASGDTPIGGNVVHGVSPLANKSVSLNTALASSDTPYVFNFELSSSLQRLPLILNFRSRNYRNRLMRALA